MTFFKIQNNSVNFGHKLAQISFLLTRFNFTSSQFRQEINRLNSNLTANSFTDKLLAKLHHLLILELWNREPHFSTSQLQFQGIKRLINCLDLNHWLEMAAKITNSDYDPTTYELTRFAIFRQLVYLTNLSHEPKQEPPVTNLHSNFPPCRSSLRATSHRRKSDPPNPRASSPSSRFPSGIRVVSLAPV